MSSEEVASNNNEPRNETPEATAPLNIEEKKVSNYPKPDDLESHADAIAQQPKFSQLEIVRMFRKLDKEGTCSIPTDKFIAALKSSPADAESFGLATDLQKESGLRDTYTLVFGKVDLKTTKSITVRSSVDPGGALGKKFG